MGISTICIGENKDTDQLCSNCEADQRIFFATRLVHFLFFLNPKFTASNPSVTVQPSLNLTWSEPKLLVFSCTDVLAVFASMLNFMFDMLCGN